MKNGYRPKGSTQKLQNEIFLMQFIQQAIRRDFLNIDEILNPPDGQDEGVWKYEHLRYQSN